MGENGVRAENVVLNKSDIREALTGWVTGNADNGVLEVHTDGEL